METGNSLAVGEYCGDSFLHISVEQKKKVGERYKNREAETDRHTQRQ